MASSRVDDKGEIEEFDVLYKQLPPFWQDRIVKNQQRKDQSKYWVRIGALPGLTTECLEDLLKQEEIKYRTIQTTHNGFNVQGKNEAAQDKLLALAGGRIGQTRSKLFTHRNKWMPQISSRTLETNCEHWKMRKQFA